MIKVPLRRGSTETVVTNEITIDYFVGVPIGGGFLWFGNPTKIPSNCRICDGVSVLTVDFPDLYFALEGAWGQSGPSQNLPDLRGRVPRGVDDGVGRDPDRLTRTANATGGNTGDNVGSVQEDSMQGHWHEINGGVNSADDPGSPENSLTASAGGTVPINSTLQSQNYIRQPKTDGVNGTPRISSETRQKNANVYYVIRVS